MYNVILSFCIETFVSFENMLYDISEQCSCRYASTFVYPDEETTLRDLIADMVAPDKSVCNKSGLEVFWLHLAIHIFEQCGSFIL